MMKILFKYYHTIMDALSKIVDISAVSLWLLMIVEFINTGSIMVTTSIIMMLFGSIIVVFALLTYWYERHKQK